MAARGPLPPRVLSRAVAAAGARGPHSWGWAMLPPTSLALDLGQHHHDWVLRYGPARLPVPREPAGGVLYVGHSRLATSSATPGTVPPIAEGQPLTTPDGWLLAHNGAFDPWEPGLPPPSDSRYLLTLLPNVASLAGVPFGGSPQAVIVASAATREVHVVRIDGRHRPAHPLYLTRWPSFGWLVSNIAIDAHSRLLPDGLTTIEEASHDRHVA